MAVSTMKRHIDILLYWYRSDDNVDSRDIERE